MSPNKCILKLTSQSVTHMQSFKEICDMVQNGHEDLRETDSLMSTILTIFYWAVWERIKIAQLQIFWGKKPMTDVVLETNKLC